MRFRASPKIPVFHNYTRLSHRYSQRQCFSLRNLHTTRASFSSNNTNSNGNAFLLPGATVATLLMLGVLHARRLYEDKKLEEAREKGIEIEFQPDVKASFLRMLPLRSISRFWGSLTSVELPVWLRPYVYRAWSRAFHSNLEEAALPLEGYASLRDFFVRSLKEGSRPIDSDPHCLISPVDGTILRFGELKGTGAMIEQVKGCSYSVSSLLGGGSMLHIKSAEDTNKESEKESKPGEESKKSWWRVSLASPKVRDHVSTRPTKSLYYCVIYLRPGDYHRIHSPVDWNVRIRRHFSGRLFPVNERAARTIKNLYVENERIVLEGLWQEGFMAIAAIGATNIGSIELYMEPELRTNLPRKKIMNCEPPDERFYEGVGKNLKKGDEAPTQKSVEMKDASSEFKFEVKRGGRIKVGEALGRWHG